MRKLIIIAVCLLSFASCTKKSTSTGSGTGGGTPGTGTTPVSTFNITIDGHSYNEPPLSMTAQTFSLLKSNGGNYMVFNLNCVNNKVLAAIKAYKLDASTGTGTYIADNSPFVSFGSTLVTDYGDGGKMYINNNGAALIGSVSVNVTVSNGSQCKGTFDMNLEYNGSLHNIKGNFDYRK
jgi:hypothetical protein